MIMLVALIGAHCFFDFAGQGDFMSKAKSRSSPIPGVPWAPVLAAHAAIHGAAVAVITGVWWLFLAEAAMHFMTDDAKCSGKIDFNRDQLIHIGCKVVWWGIALALA
jgi:hypothetical protein